MRDFQRATGRAWALRQLARLLARDVVSFALALVARFAEVGVTPAEPLGDRAAELALEFHEVGAVVLATRVAKAKLLGGTLGADELFRFEFLLGCLSCDAIFHTAEVGRLALVAGVVGKFEESPVLQVVVVVVVRVLQSRVFVDALVFRALNAHHVDLLLHAKEGL